MDKNLLNYKICKLQAELNKMVVSDASQEEILKMSQRLDKLMYKHLLQSGRK